MAKPARTTFQATDASDAVSHFSLLAGGPLYRLARRWGLAAPPAGFVRLGIVIALFAWLPLLVLAPFGRDDAAISFLHSLGTHARLLVAIALFFVAEAWFDKRSRDAVRTLVDSRLVRAEQISAFRSALLEAIKWRDAWMVEAAVVVITLLFILVGPRSDLPREVSTWRTTAEGNPTPAGWWYAMVSFPVFQFLLWRWGARMLIWWRLLWRVNRLDLQLPPAHPDLAAGLGSFGDAHLTLAPLTVGVSTMLAASFAEDILYAGADVSRFALPLAGAICATVFLTVAPLLTFSPRLIRVKQEGLLAYGTLAAGYVHAFDDKWIRQKAWQREPLLGSADVQSLADVANSFDVVRSMRIVPLSLFQVLLVVGAATLPALPLALFVIPADELILKALGAIFKV